MSHLSYKQSVPAVSVHCEHLLLCLLFRSIMSLATNPDGALVMETAVNPRACAVAGCWRACYTWCSRCQLAWYCSQYHLNAVRGTLLHVVDLSAHTFVKDWMNHRLSCTPLAFQTNTVSRQTLHVHPDVAGRMVVAYAFWPSEGILLLLLC